MTATHEKQFNKFHFIGRRDNLRGVVRKLKYKTYAERAGYVYGVTSEREAPKSASECYLDWQEARAKGIEI